MDICNFTVNIIYMSISKFLNSKFFSRALGFGIKRTTEDVQRAILVFIDTNTDATPNNIHAAMFTTENNQSMTHEILQAAQILANHNEIIAFDENKLVINPIYGNSNTVFKRKPNS